MLSQTSFSSSTVGSDTSSEISRDGQYGVDRPRMIAERKRKTKRKEFPPPIRSLARTEDPPEHMPSVLKRYYTRDGRLILREETMTHHEYFRAHRSNGRLTLQLVALNDVVCDREGEDGEIIECGEEQRNACFSVTSQPSIKCLESCPLVPVPGPEMIPPVHTL